MEYTTMGDFTFEQELGVPFTFVSNQQPAARPMTQSSTEPVTISCFPNKRRSHTEAQWDPLKPVIEKLWLIENLPFKQVAKVLAKEHSFYPTKRQFDRITNTWGFRKYLKKKEMKIIVQKQQLRSVEGKKTAVKVYGQEVPAAKIARWQRRNIDVEHLLDTGTSVTPGLPEIVCYTPESAMDLEPSINFLRYGNVGIMDSPKFTRLIEALKIDTGDIPPLVLDSFGGSSEPDQAIEKATTNRSGRQGSVVLTDASSQYLTTSSLESHYCDTAGGSFLVAEVSPFPSMPSKSSRSPQRTRAVQSGNTLQYKRAEEIQCRRRLSELKLQADRGDSPQFLDILAKLGEIFIQQGIYRDAEKIFRRVSRTREATLGYEDSSTLKAYSWFAQVMYTQGKHTQAEPIIRRLYSTSLHTLGPEHEVSIASTSLMSGIALKFGNPEEMKRLARQVLQINLQNLGPRHEMTIRAMCWLAQELGAVERENLCRTALQICEDAACDDLQEVAISAAREVAFALRFQERKEDSLRQFRDILERSRVVYGSEHRMTLQFRSEISHSLALADQFEESERMSRQTLVQQRRVPGVAIYEALYTLEVSAFALGNLNRFAEAEKGCIRTTEGLGKLCGRYHTDTVAVIEDLGNLYEKQGRSGDAIALYKRKYDEFEYAGIENTLALKILFLLGKALYSAKQFRDAANCFGRLVEKHERLLGETHEDTLAYYEWLGDCYECLKQYEEQVKLYQQKHDKLQLSAVENEHTLRIWFLFGRSLYSTKRFEDAAECFTGLIERQETLIGEAHTDTIDTYEWLGDCHNEQEQYNEQIALFQRKHDRLRASGIETEQTLRVLFLFGWSLFRTENYKDAATHFRALVEMRERILGCAHKDTLASYWWLGRCYYHQKQYEEAIELYQQMNHQFTCSGIEDEHTLEVLFRLGMALYKSGRTTDAVDCFTLLIAKREALFGPDNPATLDVVQKLGWCYESQRRYTSALSMYQQALEGYERQRLTSGVIDEDTVALLVDDISQMRLHIESASGDDMSEADESRDESEGSESNDESEGSESSDMEVTWSNYVEFEDLDEILPGEVLVI